MSTGLAQTRIDRAMNADDLIEAIQLVHDLLGWSWRIGNLPSGRFFCTLGANDTETVADTPARAMLENLNDHMTSWRMN